MKLRETRTDATTLVGVNGTEDIAQTPSKARHRLLWAGLRRGVSLLRSEHRVAQAATPLSAGQMDANSCSRYGKGVRQSIEQRVSRKPRKTQVEEWALPAVGPAALREE